MPVTVQFRIVMFCVKCRATLNAFIPRPDPADPDPAALVAGDLVASELKVGKPANGKPDDVPLSIRIARVLEVVCISCNCFVLTGAPAQAAAPALAFSVTHYPLAALGPVSSHFPTVRRDDEPPDREQTERTLDGPASLYSATAPTSGTLAPLPLRRLVDTLGLPEHAALRARSVPPGPYGTATHQVTPPPDTGPYGTSTGPRLAS